MFSNTKDETQAFHARLSRCRGLLYFIASRALYDGEGVDEAVENCFLTAIRNPKKFASEGSFRSWLLRILVNEALQILRRKRSLLTDSQELVCSQER
jgi:RNA polymerase sigma factor (sigma-70 family)